jgi:signal peptidase II
VIINRRFTLWAIVILVFLLDQLTKSLAQKYFTVVCNQNFAFGLGSGTTLVTLVVITIVFWLLIHEKRSTAAIGLALIFGGGLSNIFDRVNFGCVRDFISIGVLPSFNIADSFLTAGALVVFVDIFKRRK